VTLHFWTKNYFSDFARLSTDHDGNYERRACSTHLFKLFT